MKNKLNRNLIGAVVASFAVGLPLAGHAQVVSGDDGLAISLGFAMDQSASPSVSLAAGVGTHVTAASVSTGGSTGALASSSHDGSNHASVNLDEGGAYEATVSFHHDGILETLGALDNLQKCTTTDGLSILEISSTNPSSALGELSGAFLGYDAATETACYFDGQP